jgi:hypothetical protein
MKTKREFLLSNLNDLIDYYSDEKIFKIRLTNYSTKITVNDESIFLSDSKPDKEVFMLYNKMKSEILGEMRNEEKNYKYFCFSGLRNFSGDCSSVDINSAYLTVLKNEKIISEKTYNDIFKRTQGKKKENRLKAVGMFAKNPTEIVYYNGKPFSIINKRDIYSWVFFLAVSETYKAMEAVKKELKREFLFYWVDGIFLRKNENKAIQILKDLNFESKIENIEKLENNDGIITYFKDQKEKMLFLPKNQKEEKYNLLKFIEKKI